MYGVASLCVLMLLGAGRCKSTEKKPEFTSYLRAEWLAWKELHGRKYDSLREETKRSYVWLDNKKFIEEHNMEVEQHGYSLGMNHFGDMTESEWKKSYLGYVPMSNATKSKVKIYKPTSSDFPEEVDWRAHNAVVHVKNQGSCNASYAFSAAGALEGAISLAHDKLYSLSEQNIIDCSIPYGNHGCHTGNTYLAFQYVIDAEGLDLEVTYPFRAVQGQCMYHPMASGAHISGVVSIKRGNERELLAAVATVGPISIAVDASSNAFRFYSGGIFDTIHCSSTHLNHAMVVIGYGAARNGKKYWVVKNSWGHQWGERGFIKMTRESFNQCGVATDAMYPTL